MRWFSGRDSYLVIVFYRLINKKYQGQIVLILWNEKASDLKMNAYIFFLTL